MEAPTTFSRIVVAHPGSPNPEQTIHLTFIDDDALFAAEAALRAEGFEIGVHRGYEICASAEQAVKVARTFCRR